MQDILQGSRYLAQSQRSLRTRTDAARESYSHLDPLYELEKDHGEQNSKILIITCGSFARLTRRSRYYNLFSEKLEDILKRLHGVYFPSKHPSR